MMGFHDDQPSWTAHDSGSRKFEHTVSLSGRLFRQFGHIDQRGVRQVGMVVVENDASFAPSATQAKAWHEELALAE
jgi:hypothetical protein